MKLRNPLLFALALLMALLPIKRHSNTPTVIAAPKLLPNALRAAPIWPSNPCTSAVKCGA